LEQQFSRNENLSKMTPEKPVESHSNNFFPVGSLYCISLLGLDQVKELELEKRTLWDVAFNEKRPFQNC